MEDAIHTDHVIQANGTVAANQDDSCEAVCSALPSSHGRGQTGSDSCAEQHLQTNQQDTGAATGPLAQLAKALQPHHLRPPSRKTALSGTEAQTNVLNQQPFWLSQAPSSIPWGINASTGAEGASGSGPEPQPSRVSLDIDKAFSNVLDELAFQEAWAECVGQDTDSPVQGSHAAGGQALEQAAQDNTSPPMPGAFGSVAAPSHTAGISTLFAGNPFERQGLFSARARRLHQGPDSTPGPFAQPPAEDSVVAETSREHSPFQQEGIVQLPQVLEQVPAQVTAAALPATMVLPTVSQTATGSSAGVATATPNAMHSFRRDSVALEHDSASFRRRSVAFRQDSVSFRRDSIAFRRDSLGFQQDCSTSAVMTSPQDMAPPPSKLGAALGSAVGVDSAPTPTDSLPGKQEPGNGAEGVNTLSTAGFSGPAPLALGAPAQPALHNAFSFAGASSGGWSSPARADAKPAVHPTMSSSALGLTGRSGSCMVIGAAQVLHHNPAAGTMQRQQSLRMAGSAGVSPSLAATLSFGDWQGSHTALPSAADSQAVAAHVAMTATGLVLRSYEFAGLGSQADNPFEAMRHYRMMFESSAAQPNGKSGMERAYSCAGAALGKQAFSGATDDSTCEPLLRQQTMAAGLQRQYSVFPGTRLVDPPAAWLTANKLSSAGTPCCAIPEAAWVPATAQGPLTSTSSGSHCSSTSTGSHKAQPPATSLQTSCSSAMLSLRASEKVASPLQRVSSTANAASGKQEAVDASLPDVWRQGKDCSPDDTGCHSRQHTPPRQHVQMDRQTAMLQEYLGPPAGGWLQGTPELSLMQDLWTLEYRDARVEQRYMAWLHLLLIQPRRCVDVVVYGGVLWRWLHYPFNLLEPQWRCALWFTIAYTLLIWAGNALPATWSKAYRVREIIIVALYPICVWWYVPHLARLALHRSIADGAPIAMLVFSVFGAQLVNGGVLNGMRLRWCTLGLPVTYLSTTYVLLDCLVHHFRKSCSLRVWLCRVCMVLGAVVLLMAYVFIWRLIRVLEQFSRDLYASRVQQLWQQQQKQAGMASMEQAALSCSKNRVVEEQHAHSCSQG